MDIGFIGLGQMGSHMARRLLEAGHSLTVMDLNPAAVKAMTDKGARSATTAREVADQTEVVFVSLPSPQIVEQAALGPDGVIHGQRARTFVDLSTTGPMVAGRVAAGLGERQLVALDAPVSGGVKGAREGTLAVMVGGPQATYEELLPALQVIGKVFFMGETPGAGQTMKLVNNLMSICAVAITSEGMAFGRKAGLDPKLMIEVLNVSSGRSSATQDKWPRAVLPRSFDFGFATGLAFKDLRLCLEEAEAMGVPMIVGSALRQFVSITNQTYGADSDFTVMARLAESFAKVGEPEPVKP